MQKLPKVTQEEFDTIICNKCGDCCESFWQPSPEVLAKYIAQYEKEKRTFEYYDPYFIGWTPKDFTYYFINQRRLAWYKDIVPTGVSRPLDRDEDEKANHVQYRCTRFQRLSEDEGICTRHDERPDICANFPYGRPVGKEFPRCSWRVKVVSS